MNILHILISCLFLIASCTSYNRVCTRTEITCDKLCTDKISSQACIGSVVTAGSYNIKCLYEQALKRDRGCKGDIKVSFVITKDGLAIVKDLKNTTIRDSVFLKEIVSEINKWHFCPTPEGKDIDVVYPFSFEAATE